MAHTILQQNNINSYNGAAKSHSVINRFINWCTVQDADHHIAWAGVSLIATTAVLFPLTMAVTLLSGASFQLIIAAMVALVLVAVLNLAALPTRYTIPAFALGVLIDAGVIITSLLVH